MKYLVFAALALCVSGCDVLSTKVGPKLAKVVMRYCEQPQDARLALREQVNTLIAPNHVQVNCVGDTPPQ